MNEWTESFPVAWGCVFERKKGLFIWIFLSLKGEARERVKELSTCVNWFLLIKWSSSSSFDSLYLMHHLSHWLPDMHSLQPDSPVSFCGPQSNFPSLPLPFLSLFFFNKQESLVLYMQEKSKECCTVVNWRGLSSRVLLDCGLLLIYCFHETDVSRLNSGAPGKWQPIQILLAVGNLDALIIWQPSRNGLYKKGSRSR